MDDLERNGNIRDLIGETNSAFSGAPFELVNTGDAPVGDCRRPRSWQGEPIPTQISILTKSPDGEVAWLGETKMNLATPTDYKVMLVMFDADVVAEQKQHEEDPTSHQCRGCADCHTEFCEHLPDFTCQIEGAPAGIVPAWMSCNGWSTPIEEMISVMTWRTGFNCGRQTGTAQALAHHAAAMTKDVERGELYGG